MAHRTRIVLTGAAGTLGRATLEAWGRSEARATTDLVAVDVRTPRTRRRLPAAARRAGAQLHWADLTRYVEVRDALAGADVILHAAAVIPPAADHDPVRTWAVNVEGTANVVRAVQARADPSAVRLVFVGSVAQTGDRRPPFHVGRIGDPMAPSVFDVYACSKVAAERVVAESGLLRWVSLRMTFIAHAGLGPQALMLHQPLDTCLEAVTQRTAGRALAAAARDDLPDGFWRRFYNVGGGPAVRTTYRALLADALRALGLGDVRRLCERRWFATRNFHSHWFEDAHVLDAYLRFQGEGLKDILDAMRSRAARWAAPLLRAVPARLLRRLVFARIASRPPDGTKHWIDAGAGDRIAAFYGSRAAYDAIPEWEPTTPPPPLASEAVRLRHGYDDRKSDGAIDLADAHSAAAFRGWTLLSPAMRAGDLATPLRWRCGAGHAFDATPNLILRGGHGCPECAPPPWAYAAQAAVNPFLAQVRGAGMP